MRKHGFLTYLHRDHPSTPFRTSLGSIFATTNSSGNFTGQYHESSLPGGEGLSYYGARWYDATLGRFLNADSIVLGPTNPL